MVSDRVTNERRSRLYTALADEMGKHSTLTPDSCMFFAGFLVERIVEEGWQPPKVTLTPEQEVDILDRIVHGLPSRLLKHANPEGPNVYKKQRLDMVFPDGEPVPDEVKLVDVASTGCVEVDLWTRIPDFDNYEINPLGVIRSRWTKRLLSDDDYFGEGYVEMHDKDGNPHVVNAMYIKEQVFG